METPEHLQKDNRTIEQYEASKRQKNTKYWAENYGIYISPHNHEDYLWFRHHKTLVLKLLPILAKVNEIQVPLDQRDDRSQAPKPLKKIL